MPAVGIYQTARAAIHCVCAGDLSRGKGRQPRAPCRSASGSAVARHWTAAKSGPWALVNSMQAFTGGARLAQVAAAAPPLSSEAAALLAAQTNPMADGPALPKFSSLIAGLGVAPDRSGPPPPPGSRLPLRLLSSPTDPERTLWKTIAELGLHEILSLEFVDALAEHILSALPPAAVGQPGDAAALPVVLEVGAGSGALAHQLSIRLDGRARVVASDDFSSRLATVIDVSPLDCAAALSEHSPALVLISWMPSGVDWTAGTYTCSPSITFRIQL